MDTTEQDMTAIDIEKDEELRMRGVCIQKEDGETLHPADLNKEYKKLKMLFNLQQRIVQNNMHKAMSPISAISGYLELIKIYLQKDADKEKVEQYRDKIEDGVEELSEIVEDLHEIFDEEDEERKESVTFSEANPKKNRRAS